MMRLVLRTRALAATCLVVLFFSGGPLAQPLPVNYTVRLASATVYDTRSRGDDTAYAALSVFVNGNRTGTAIWDGKGWDGSRMEGRAWASGLHVFGTPSEGTVHVPTGRLQETDTVQIVFQILNSTTPPSSSSYESAAARIQQSTCAGGDAGSAWECLAPQSADLSCWIAGRRLRRARRRRQAGLYGHAAQTQDRNRRHRHCQPPLQRRERACRLQQFHLWRHCHDRAPVAVNRSKDLHYVRIVARRRRASVADARSLSASPNAAAVWSAARAAAWLALPPALSISFPSSRCARPCTHLRPSDETDLPQILFRLFAAAERRPRGAPLVEPQRLFAEHPFALVVGEPCQPLVQKAFGIGGTPGAQRGRPTLQPRQPVPRVSSAQERELLQRLVVPLFAVVHEHQREPGVFLVFAAVRRRLLDHPDAACLVAAEARHVGDQPHRQRERRDDVSIGADDEAGILPAVVELQHFLVRVVRLARRAEGARSTAFDRRDIGGTQPDGRADLVVRLGVARIRLDRLAGERQGLVRALRGTPRLRRAGRGGRRPSGG